MRLACVGVRMVVIPTSPILVVDNKDSLRAGRCRTSLKIPIQCRRDKNSVSSPPLEPCFDVPNNSPNHLLNSLLLCLEKLAKKSSNQTTHLFSCQNSL